MLKSEPEVQRLWELADQCRQELDLAAAIACYQQIIQLRPRRTDVYCQLGNLYSEQQQPLKAIQAYQQAIAINPAQPPWVYQILGKALQEEQQVIPAIAAFQQAIRLDTATPSWVYRHLADLLVKQQQYP